MGSGEPERGALGTVRNASVLLDLLSEGAAYQQLTDLAERSELSLPTVHRLLRSLVLAGLVEQDPTSSRYSLGPELLRLSGRYLARLPALRALSPYLVELRNSTKATVLVAVLVGASVVYIDRIDGEDVGGIFREPHRVLPALETAAGRVLLGRADAAARQHAVAELHDQGTALTDADLCTWEGAPFLVVDSHGSGDHLEVAVPVLDGAGRAHAALSATGDPASFGEDLLTRQIAPQLQRTAKAAGRALTHG